jgi:hypothetical protein
MFIKMLQSVKGLLLTESRGTDTLFGRDHLLFNTLL